MKNEKLFELVADYLNGNSNTLPIEDLRHQLNCEVKGLNEEDVCVLFITNALIDSGINDLTANARRGMTLIKTTDGVYHLVYSRAAQKLISDISWKLKEFSGNRIYPVPAGILALEPEWELKMA